MWNQRSQQVAELQVLWVDVENKKKAGDNFYKMDKESIVTIWEELSDDFSSLAGTHLEAIWRIIEGPDYDQLGTQLQFARYEWECWQLEVERREAAINIHDEEQSVEPQLQQQPNQY